MTMFYPVADDMQVVAAVAAESDDVFAGVQVVVAVVDVDVDVAAAAAGAVVQTDLAVEEPPGLKS